MISFAVVTRKLRLGKPESENTHVLRSRIYTVLYLSNKQVL
jgi:hypothetical protein